jgi:hypothetical protein
VASNVQAKVQADSVSELLARRAATIRDLYVELLKHSELYFWNTPEPGFVFISIDGDWAWRDLDEEGQRVQSRLLREYRTYADLLSVLLRGQPERVLDDLKTTNETIVRLFEQSSSTWNQTLEAAREEVSEKIEKQLALVGGLYDPSEGTAVFVPDTNALYHYPDLDAWRFRGASPFVLLLANVLAELDEAKINPRNPRRKG